MSQRHPQIREVVIANEVLLPTIIALLNEGKTVTLRLRGISMRPFLEDNRDCAVLRKSTDPKLWEPVLAELPNKRFVFHRIVKIEGDHVTLRGDGNIGVEHCKLSDIKAQTVGFYRKDRKKLETLDSWKWKAYSCLWTRTLPLRPYILAIDRRLNRLMAKLKRNNK